MQVEGPKQDLHSGVYGGTVIEPMTDLIGILGECSFYVASETHSFNHSYYTVIIASCQVVEALLSKDKKDKKTPIHTVTIIHNHTAIGQ